MARAKGDVAEHLAVRAHRDLVFRTAIQIIKDDLRQTALRQSAKILDVDGARKLAHNETPRFQGMKSSCASNSAAVRTSPLAI